MNWWIGVLSDGSAHFVRWTGADGTTILMVAGLTRAEALAYPISYIRANVKAAQEDAFAVEAHKAQLAAAREAELLRALSEVQPQGRPS